MSAYVEDLFGEPCAPVKERIPRRGSRDYLAYINALTLPDGLTFWSLAEPVEGVPSHVEAIWCVDRQRQQHYLLIDLRTGQRYAP